MEFFARLIFTQKRTSVEVLFFLYYKSTLAIGMPIHKTKINSAITNGKQYFMISPEVKYSLLPNIIAANGDADGVKQAEDNTKKIIKVTIGAAGIPLELQ